MRGKSHPYLIGAGAGFVMAGGAIASAIWLPNAPEPFMGMTLGGGAFCLAVVISVYWKFVGSWKLWIPLATLFTIDAVCAHVFFEQVREFSLWRIDIILAIQFAVTMLFLAWFLDTKKTRRRE